MPSLISLQQSGFSPKALEIKPSATNLCSTHRTSLSLNTLFCSIWMISLQRSTDANGTVYYNLSLLEPNLSIMT